MKIYKYLIETPGSTHIMDHLTDIVSTGLDMNNNDKYLGMINDGEYIWHIIKSSGEKCRVMEEK